MGSGLKAQNMTGIRVQRKGLRAQKNGIRDHKAFEPESGIRFITRSKNLLLQYFSNFLAEVHYLFLFPAGGSPCHMKNWLFDENIMVSYS